MTLRGGGGYPRKKPKKRALRFSSDAYKALRLINKDQDPDAWGIYRLRFKESYELQIGIEEIISMLESYLAGDKDALSSSIWANSNDEEINETHDRYLKEREENLQDIQDIICRIHARFSKEKN